MKNMTEKQITSAIAAIGYVFILLGAKKMSASVTITFVFCWTAFVLAVLFAFSPEISRLVLKKDKVELDRYKKQVDKALVEYDEFKQTIYPLLEASMGQIVSVRYLQMPPKTSVMINYVPLVEKAIEVEQLNQPEIQELLRAVKSMTLYGFSIELGRIADKSSNGKIEQEDVEKLVRTGLEEDYSKKVYVHIDDIGVDFASLDAIAQRLPDSQDKNRYEDRLAKLKKFYNQYYAN